MTSFTISRTTFNKQLDDAISETNRILTKLPTLKPELDMTNNELLETIYHGATKYMSYEKAVEAYSEYLKELHMVKDYIKDKQSIFKDDNKTMWKRIQWIHVDYEWNTMQVNLTKRMKEYPNLYKSSGEAQENIKNLSSKMDRNTTINFK